MPNPAKIQFPERGPIVSRDLNKFFEDVKEELARLSEQVEEQQSELSRRRLDEALSRAAGAAASAQRKLEEKIKLASEVVDIIDTTTVQTQTHTFFDGDGIHYLVDDGAGNLNGYDINRRCRLESKYGQMSLPINGIKSMFWSPGIDSEESVYMPETAISIEELSSQAADIIETTDARNAFDSTSRDPYLIRAVYPLDSDVTEAIFNVNIKVPQDIVRRANVLSLDPVPDGRCFITGIKYSDSALIATTVIPGLPTINVNNPIYDSTSIRFTFDTIDIVSLQIQIGSKHYEIENGRKVFYVGFRELGLFLVDWDQTWSNTTAFTNNGFFIKLSIPQVEGIAPSPAYFNSIEEIAINPAVGTSTVPTGTDTGVRVRIFYDDLLTTAGTWDSISSGPLPFTVPGDTDHVWLAIELDRNNGSGLVPLLTGLEVKYTIKS